MVLHVRGRRRGSTPAAIGILEPETAEAAPALQRHGLLERDFCSPQGTDGEKCARYLDRASGKPCTDIMNPGSHYLQ
jgi:hypothetical protein